MSRPMLVAVDMTEHDGRGAAQSAAMGCTHHLEPLVGADLVRAKHGAHLVVEDFRRCAWQRAEPRRLQRAEEALDRDAERRGALMHFERRKRVDMDGWRGAFHGPANVEIFGAGVARMDAALHADFAGAARPGLAHALFDLAEREIVGPAAQRLALPAFGNGAEAGFEVTE